MIEHVFTCSNMNIDKIDTLMAVCVLEDVSFLKNRQTCSAVFCQEHIGRHV